MSEFEESKTIGTVSTEVWYMREKEKAASLQKQIEMQYVEIERLQKEYSMVFEAVQGRQKTIDELRSTIDKALERANHAHIGYGMLYAQFNDVVKILNGETSCKHSAGNNPVALLTDPPQYKCIHCGETFR